MSATIPGRYRGQTRRDAAAFYLGELGRGILAGEIAVTAGQHATRLAATEFVLLEIEVRHAKRADQVVVKIRWPRTPRTFVDREK